MPGKLTITFLLGILVLIITLVIVFFLLPLIFTISLADLGVDFTIGALIVIWTIIYAIVMIGLGVYYFRKIIKPKKN
jgi:lysylphosphatidylglycerol synthetase-like protein (DUF2156 family)